MSDNGNGLRVLYAVINSMWIKQLIQGCLRRIVDILLPNKAVNRYVIGGCFRILAREWNNIIERDTDILYGLHCVATAVCVIVAGY